MQWNASQLTVIVPAAGFSRRMGRFKLLLPWPPNSSGLLTVIESTLLHFISAGLTRIIVVTGHMESRMQEHLKHYPVLFAHNPDPSTTMIRSIQIALVTHHTEGPVMICPGDHPAVSAGTIREIAAHHLKQPDRIIVPLYQGRRGHPVVIPASLNQELRRDDLPCGVRSILQTRPDQVFCMQTGDAGVRHNLDYPEDYHLSESGRTPPGRHRMEDNSDARHRDHP